MSLPFQREPESRAFKRPKQKDRWMFRATLVGVFVLAILAGCTSDAEKSLRFVNGQLPSVEASIKVLNEHLINNRLSNANTLKSYASQLAAAKPELTELTEALALEATPEGALFKSLPDRLWALRLSMPKTSDDPKLVQAAATTFREVYFAAQPEEFDRALADPINVLADLSDGQLPRVDSVTVDAESRLNPTTMARGTQLIGNPHYGEWRSDSSGSSFWSWYIQYSLMRQLLGGNDYYYSSWATGRRYSYYHDYGRGHYTSPKQRSQAKSTETRARQKFAQTGKAFQSPYDRRRSGASRRVTQAKKSFRAPSASTRTRSSMSSRSSSRGK